MQLAELSSLAAREPRARAELLSRLLEITRREHSLPCVHVRAKSAHSLSSVNIDTPLLALPVQGRKRFRDSNGWIRIVPGEIFLIPYPTTIDIENFPDEVSGWYSAVCIPLEDHVLNAARQLIRKPIAVGRGGIACVPLDPHVEDLTNWLDALEQGDFPRACHAVVGVVLRLYAQGHHSLLHPPVPTLATRIRAMVAADPMREWASADVEGALGMSGATLRRHLAAEGMSLRQVIGDVRLTHALMLLLSKRLPVKSVARLVGYASVSTFIKRFRERYGVEPSRVESL